MQHFRNSARLALLIDEQRRLRDQLLQTQADLEHAQEIAHLGIWAADVRTGIVETTSPETFRIFRISEDTQPIRIDDLYQRIHPDDLERVLEARRRALSVPGVRYDCQYRVMHADDDVRYVHSLADVVTDAEGRPTRIVGVIQDVTEMQRAQQEIQRLAFFDETTGLPNRVAMRQHLEAVFGVDNGELQVAVLIIELAHFRQINLSLGNLNGDDLLRNVAHRIALLLGSDAHLSRTANAQFTAILQGAHAGAAQQVAASIARAFEKTFLIAGVQYEISAHVGIAVAPPHASDPTSLVRKADVAVFQARQNGRSSMAYTPIQDPYDPNRLALLGEFRQAISEGEIELYCHEGIGVPVACLAPAGIGAADRGQPVDSQPERRQFGA